jgi:hypothetical protein
VLFFSFFSAFLVCFFYIQTFFYTIMNLFITLLENVNKSRTSASNVSLMFVFLCSGADTPVYMAMLPAETSPRGALLSDRTVQAWG